VAGGQNDLGILASWEIDLWGRVKRNIEASGATAEASVDDLAAMKLSLQAQLAQNYFNLRVQDAEIRLLQDTTSAYERLLKVTKNQYAVGVADRGNVLQVQTQQLID
jgi:outer membrane protein TolC